MSMIHIRWERALFALGILSTGALALPAQGASFDCAKASTTVEKTICGNEKLSALDDQLATLYKRAIRESGAPASLRQAQRTWMANRNACADQICIERAYAERINLLYRGLKGNDQQSQSSFRYQIVNGTGQSLCETLAGRMNEEIRKLKPGGTLCGYDVLRSIPGVTFLRWKKLDVQKNKPLYERFVLANLVRAEFYSKIFRETSVNNYIIQMPTKEQMSWRRERMFTKPGSTMNEKWLDLGWQEAVAKGTSLYEVAGIFSGRDESDVLLIEMSTIDQFHLKDSCPHFRFARFSAGPGYPEPLDAGTSRWITEPMGFPFKFGGEKMVFRETLSEQPRLSNGLTIMMPPDRLYCLIQGNIYFTPK